MTGIKGDNRNGIHESEWPADMYSRVHRGDEDLSKIFPRLDKGSKLDAILIPGGGLEPNGEVKPWITRSLDAAIALQDKVRYIIVLSRGTVYKPPIIKGGFPLDESIAQAKYLSDNGVPNEKIITENLSKDTLGNAYFGRVSITDPMELRSLLVINPVIRRSRILQIFDFVFNLPPDNQYSLHFYLTHNIGFTQEELNARSSKELDSFLKLRELIGRTKTLSDLARYIFTEHEAYRVGGVPITLDQAVLRSY